jgi:mannose-6-phosphate isomerase-like protein (cupin superfamily)
MRRFIVNEDLAYRAGYTKVAAGQAIKTFFWYDEFWVVLEGRGKVTAIDRPSNTTIEEQLSPHDLVYIPAGTHITMDSVPEDGSHILFFYIAIPASSKHAPWIASMTPEDIEDIKLRQEHTKEGAAIEGQRGKPLTR